MRSTSQDYWESVRYRESKLAEEREVNKSAVAVPEPVAEASVPLLHHFSIGWVSLCHA